ncbi:MAG: M28 family peptidase [Bacteroidia bacterium]
MKIRIAAIILGVACVLSSCKEGGKKPNKPIEKPPVEKNYTLKFNADSAYQYVKDQVDFGPRVPGSMEHGLAANYLYKQMKRLCDTALMQQGSMPTGTGQTVAIKNIIGSFSPEKKQRVLLAAHWDTRPQADEDKERPNSPADGANDGASGVGVLIEMARQFQMQKPDVGVDIIFFDAEDMGSNEGGQNSWCLGSQFWSKNLHLSGYDAKYGILLDMVGAPDAVFAFERNSVSSAEWLVKHVWRVGIGLGFNKYFVPFQGGYITDDHVFVTRGTGIPMIDIIHYDANNRNGFGSYWHTHEDNMDVVSAETLKAVGLTVLKTVYEE